jgi:phage tail sheath protein FI
MDDLKYGAAYYPSIETTLAYQFDESAVTISYSATPNPFTNAQIANGMTVEDLKEKDTAAYASIQNEVNKIKVKLYPSGAMAGVYARIDSQRGVWKAPANVTVKSVIGPTKGITNLDQDDMNVDTVGGKSVNAIRAFTGKGTLVWGARTLAGNDNEWRYVSVRRFFNMVEESVKKSTYWAVFEPNDANTWVKVKSMIENYLILKWKDGALQGAKPEHAFYVKVGLGETMTALDILEGRMNVEIGMAVVRPAEFIILKFSHKMAES